MPKRPPQLDRHAAFRAAAEATDPTIRAQLINAAAEIAEFGSNLPRSEATQRDFTAAQEAAGRLAVGWMEHDDTHPLIVGDSQPDRFSEAFWKDMFPSKEMTS